MKHNLKAKKRFESFSKSLQLIILLTAVSICVSCRRSHHEEKSKDVVQEWIGKEIKFPEIKTCAILGKYAPCAIVVPKPYRILVYTDSIGCTSCELRIDVWKMLMKQADTLVKGKVNFQFYFNPKKDEDLADLFKRENFRDLVYMDLNDELNKTNQFPKSMEYQCFLLDSDNKVLVVGNPTLNSNVWELYKKTIQNDTRSEK